MALTHPHIQLFVDLRRQSVVGPGHTETLLEFGEQNWFGDVNARELAPLIEEFAAPTAKIGLRKELDDLAATRDPVSAQFGLAKLFYKVVLGVHSYSAVDLQGTDAASKCDLNFPLPLAGQCDVLTNIGTAEHVFNQLQFFQSVHEKTRPSGLMIHTFPNQGSYDHGFYNYHPTFVFDLCDANRYQLLGLVYVDERKERGKQRLQINSREDYVRLALAGKLSDYSGMQAVLRKSAQESSFTVPKQGYYTKGISPELRDAWNRLAK
jgi:hypothetical protein